MFKSSSGINIEHVDFEGRAKVRLCYLSMFDLIVCLVGQDDPKER